MNNYPYVLPIMPGMPNITMSPNMGFPNNYPSVTNNVNTNEDEINRLNNRINMLERRVAILEGNNSYGNYSSNSYQML